MTQAQIEIMQADIPHPLYDTEEKKSGKTDGRKAGKKAGSPRKDFKVNPNDKAFRLQQEAYERALRRRDNINE